MTASKPDNARNARNARTDREPFHTGFRIEPTGETAWKATEPASDTELWGRGDTPSEAVERYCQLIQRGCDE